jgi:hypothetical protein
MRRLMLLVMLVLFMTAFLAMSAGAAQAVGRVPFGPSGGIPVDQTICSVLTDGTPGAMFEWRAEGQVCWVNFPAQEAHDLVE